MSMYKLEMQNVVHNLSCHATNSTSEILFCSSVPTNPVNTTLAKVVGSPTELYIQWEPPEEPNGIIVAYNVYCTEMIANDTQVLYSGSGSIPVTTSSGSGTMTAMPREQNDMPQYAILVVTNGTESEVFVEVLTPFTNYGCFITANTSVGEGTSSMIVTATTDESSKAYFLLYCMDKHKHTDYTDNYL